jgi:hypothetical protein
MIIKRSKKIWLALGSVVIVVTIVGLVIVNTDIMSNGTFMFGVSSGPEGTGRHAFGLGVVSLGIEKSDVALANGEYSFKNSGLEHEREYAMYALGGTGNVSIGSERYELNDNHFKALSSEQEEAEFYELIYQESPKVTLSADSIIIVQGDEDFAISFLW